MLTFDDGPWPNNTPAVLKALADAMRQGDVLPDRQARHLLPGNPQAGRGGGHTVGSHTWSHANLSKKSVDEAKDEIEKGISAVQLALGGPARRRSSASRRCRHPPELVTYLGERNIGIFSTDINSFDFKMRKPEQVIKSVMTKLKKHGKGIVLMHDFQAVTAQAMPELLNQLKAGGYKVVHMKARTRSRRWRSTTRCSCKDDKLPTVSQRPTSSVVRTVE